MSNEEAGQLFKALFHYAESGEVLLLSDRADMAFSFISEQMERDMDKWEKIRQKRSEAGRKGGKQTQANQAVNDNVINNKYIDQKSPTKSEIESEFEQLWELYPKKEGKKKALSCYQRARKSGTSFETVLQGVKGYQ